MPTVSLVIAAYNRKGRFADTLASVRAQSRPFDEIVVVDDCSPDGTFAWLTETEPGLRVVQTPRNGGTSAARNFGAKAATGEVIVFFDHDDLMLPTAVQNFLDLLAAFPEAHAAFTDHAYRHTGTGLEFPNHHAATAPFRRLGAVPTLRMADAGRLYGRGMYRALLRGNLLQQPYAIRRESFQKLGGYAEDVKFCEDWEFYLRLTDRYPVAQSDAISSVHIQEGEGANLSLDRRQEVMHRRVLLRRLRAELFRDPKSAVVIARRLAGYYKKAGDLAYPISFREAWVNYAKAFVLWPFDPIVFCGAVLFFLPWILTGRKRKVPDTAIPPLEAVNAER